MPEKLLELSSFRVPSEMVKAAGDKPHLKVLFEAQNEMAGFERRNIVAGMWESEEYWVAVGEYRDGLTGDEQRLLKSGVLLKGPVEWNVHDLLSIWLLARQGYSVGGEAGHDLTYEVLKENWFLDFLAERVEFKPQACVGEFETFSPEDKRTVLRQSLDFMQKETLKLAEKHEELQTIMRLEQDPYAFAESMIITPEDGECVADSPLLTAFLYLPNCNTEDVVRAELVQLLDLVEETIPVPSVWEQRQIESSWVDVLSAPDLANLLVGIGYESARLNDERASWAVEKVMQRHAFTLLLSVNLVDYDSNSYWGLEGGVSAVPENSFFGREVYRMVGELLDLGKTMYQDRHRGEW